MTLLEGASAAYCDARPRGSALGVRASIEVVLYAIGALMAALLGVFTGYSLLAVSSEDWLEAPWTGVQSSLLGVLILILGLRISYALSLALREHLRIRRCTPKDPVTWPRVSILVPAFNEEGTVVEALRSTIDIDYPDFEVIVVDDGSTDKTFERAASLAGRHRDRVDVQVLRKENAGKWSAHNFAVRHATGRYLLCVDADSRLEPDALRHMVRAIERDESIAAVAGQVRVRNRDGLLTCLQALEYLTCNGSMRTAQSFDATVLVVPGPIGLFRREVLDRVAAEFGKRGYDGTGGRYDGPFEDDSFAEDFDLSLAVLQLGYGIVYEPRAVSNTKAPSTLRSLMNQRYRWQRGSIQVLRKVMRRSRERPELLRPALLRWLLLAYAVDFVLVPLWLLIGLPYLLALYLSGSAIATSLLGFLLLMFGTNFLLSLCYASTHKDSKWLAPLCVAHDVYNTCFLQAILIFVVFDEIRGTPMRWS